MEPSRFDELTKVLATATSRRHTLKTIAATTIGGISHTWLGHDENKPSHRRAIREHNSTRTE